MSDLLELQNDPLDFFRNQIGTDKVLVSYINEDGNFVSYIGDGLNEIEIIYMLHILRQRTDDIFNQ